MCSNCEEYYDEEDYYDRYTDYGDPYDPSPPLAVLDEDDLDVNEALDLLREVA